MVANYKRVFQFKVTLLDTNPEVWRRILVPETYTFYDLHVAIQDAMGWDDCHLHRFEVNRDPKAKRKDLLSIGIPESEFDKSCKAGWEVHISDHFDLYQKKVFYQYDFGDCWDHTIEAEELMDKQVGTKYPKCIDGKNACPPEDIGGVDGFENFKAIMNDPKGEEYKEFKTWFGAGFDVKKFNPEDVKFRKPSVALKSLYR